MKLKIFTAAEQLNAQGQKPTLDKVRTAIGGGSFTTISSILKEWKLQSSTQVIAAREPTPEVITNKINEIASDIWVAAIEIANDRLLAERNSMEQLRAGLESERTEALRLADDLSTDLENEKLTTGESLQKLAGLESLLASTKQQLSDREHTNASLEARLEESDKRINDLTTALVNANQQISSMLQTLSVFSKQAELPSPPEGR